MGAKNHRFRYNIIWWLSNDEFVVLPHPLMHLREFVLEPLCEIAPYAIHPLKNKRAFELLEEIKSIEN